MKIGRWLLAPVLTVQLLGCVPKVPEKVVPPVPSSPTTPTPEKAINFEPMSLEINSGLSLTKNSQVTLNLTAQQAGEMYITTDSTCSSGGVWETYAPSKDYTLPLANQLNEIYFKVRSVDNSSTKTSTQESACVGGASVLHDNLPPNVAITSPAANSFVNLNNVTALTLSGTCSEEGQVVSLNGSYGATSPCVNGTWSVTLNLNLLVDGPLQWSFTQTDLAGNTTTTAIFPLTKDTVAPTSNSFLIQGGASYSKNFNVTLSLASLGATKMYVTNSPTCSSGGVWESFASSRSWTLPYANSLNTVYVKYQDVAGNLSPCLNQSIIHDNFPPSLSFDSPLANSIINLANVTHWDLTGTCSEEGKSVVISGAISSTVTCTSGNWSASLNATAVPNGSVTLYINHQDVAGNSASQITRIFSKNTTVPTLTLSSPVSGSAVNIANQNAVTFNGTCSESGQPVVLSGAITSSISCAGGVWSVSFDLSGFPDAPFSLAFDHQNAAGNSATQVVANYTKDTLAPTISFSAPLASDYINSSNVTSVLVSGSCSENTRTISISGSVSTSTTCSSGSFSKSVNFTAVPDGTITLNVDHTDVAGNPAAQATVSLTKDVASPSANSLVINGNATITATTAVNLVLGSTGASEMYLTEDPACSSGGVWESFATTKSWNLIATNASVSVYMKTRDLAGNTSACVSDSIIHDDTAPIWFDAPFHVAIYNSLTESPAVTYTESATDDLGSGVQKYQYAIGTGTTGDLAFDIAPWTNVAGGAFTATGLSLTEGGTYYVNMQVIDNAGNLTQQSSAGWLADTTPPVLTVNTPVNNELITEPEFAVAGSCDNAYTIEISYGTNVTGPSTLTCTGGVYKLYVEITGTSGTRTLTLSQTDSGNNSTSHTMTYNYQLRMSLNGQILAMQKLPDGSTLFGGTFNSLSLNRDMYMVRTNLDGTKDTSFTTGSGFNGQVYAFAEMADGNILVGGDFTTYRGRPANRIAKINSSGVLDTTFNPPSGNNGAAGIVRTIAVQGTSIYLGGDFTKYRGTTVNRIAKVDANGVLDTTFLSTGTVGFSSGSIYSVAVGSGVVYIGGSFTSYRGGVANRIAKVDSVTGALDTTFNPSSGNNGANNIVRTIVLNGTDVFIAGDFTAYRGTALKYLAKLSSSGVLDGTFSTTTGPSAAVYSIVTDGVSLYLGGTFTTYKSAAANRITKVNLTTAALDNTFSPSSGANGASSTVNALYLSGASLYAGGLFTTYRNLSAVRVAKMGTDGVLDTTYNPSSGANGASGNVNAILASTNGVYVGGNFYSYRNFSTANYIAKIDSAGNLDTTFNSQSAANGFNNNVRAIALSGSTIFVGGDFTTYRGAAASRIAKLDSTGVLDTTFNPASGANGTNSSVWAIAISGLDLFIGGDFTSYKGTALKYLAKLNFSGTLDATFSTTTGPSSSVYALAISGSNVYIGGKFTTYKSVSANRVAKLDYTNAALNTTFSPSASNGVNNNVNTLLIYGSSLYMGGTFTTYKGITVNRIAKVDISSGDLDTTFNGTGTVGFGSTVNALASDGTSLYVTGAFTTYRGASAKYLSKVALDSGLQDSVFVAGNGLSGFGVVGSSLFWDGSNLLVGGIFTYYQNYQFPNFTIVNASGVAQ